MGLSCIGSLHDCSLSWHGVRHGHGMRQGALGRFEGGRLEGGQNLNIDSLNPNPTYTCRNPKTVKFNSKPSPSHTPWPALPPPPAPAPPPRSALPRPCP